MLENTFLCLLAVGAAEKKIFLVYFKFSLHTVIETLNYSCKYSVHCSNLLTTKEFTEVLIDVHHLIKQHIRLLQAPLWKWCEKLDVIIERNPIN